MSRIERLRNARSEQIRTRRVNEVFERVGLALLLATTSRVIQMEALTQFMNIPLSLIVCRISARLAQGLWIEQVPIVATNTRSAKRSLPIAGRRDQRVGLRNVSRPQRGDRRYTISKKDQPTFVVRLEGISNKTISVMMEKKNPRMSQPMA